MNLEKIKKSKCPKEKNSLGKRRESRKLQKENVACVEKTRKNNLKEY